jgi:nucleotide-binding universal stress UspA family protein
MRIFRKLLVPLDGSRMAESVLPAVRRFAELLGCSVTLLHVIEKRAPSTIHGDTHLNSADQAEAYLSDIEKQMKASGIVVDSHVHTVPQGDLPKCIAEHADELDQDLVILCSHGAGGVRRFVFGSNAEQVLSHGTTPVLLIQVTEQGTAPPLGPDRILALFDGTLATEPALTVSKELAILASARLDLLVVIPTLASMNAEQAASGRLIPSATREVLDLAAEEAVSRLQTEVNQLIELKIRASGKVERGEAASAVVKTAQEVQSDLVVIAARGLAGLSAFFAGIITSKIAGVYGGSILIVPRAET